MILRFSQTRFSSTKNNIYINKLTGKTNTTKLSPRKEDAKKSTETDFTIVNIYINKIIRKAKTIKWSHETKTQKNHLRQDSETPSPCCVVVSIRVSYPPLPVKLSRWWMYLHERHQPFQKACERKECYSCEGVTSGVQNPLTDLALTRGWNTYLCLKTYHVYTWSSCLYIWTFYIWIVQYFIQWCLTFL
jgi:hypothetical protein